MNIIFQELNDYCSWQQVINLFKKTLIEDINKHIKHNEGTKISIQKYKIDTK